MANQPSVKPELNPVLSKAKPVRVPASEPVRPAQGVALTKPRIFTPHIGLNLGT